MVAFELEGVEIDHCVACGGTWLDPGELELITELAGASSGDLARASATSGDGRRTKRRCPRCPSRLREVRVGVEAEVVIDRCPEGHGLWFDRGEMAAAIRSFAGEQAGAVARFFADLYRSEIESAAGGE
jgi:Zn-finger nucleic acid-binding protein